MWHYWRVIAVLLALILSGSFIPISVLGQTSTSANSLLRGKGVFVYPPSHSSVSRSVRRCQVLGITGFVCLTNNIVGVKTFCTCTSDTAMLSTGVFSVPPHPPHHPHAAVPLICLESGVSLENSPAPWPSPPSPPARPGERLICLLCYSPWTRRAFISKGKMFYFSLNYNNEIFLVNLEIKMQTIHVLQFAFIGLRRWAQEQV